LAATLAYPAYLIALLALPLLVRWRWGLALALVVTIAELGLVFAISDLASPPNPYAIVRPDQLPPGDSPLVQIRRSQAFAMTMLLLWIILPGMAALIGGGVAIAWSTVASIWRATERWP
jgi:hypothetical protein